MVFAKDRVELLLGLLLDFRVPDHGKHERDDDSDGLNSALAIVLPDLNKYGKTYSVGTSYGYPLKFAQDEKHMHAPE